MIGLKIAAQIGCFAQSIKKALHTAAGLGCEGVQIDARSELQPAELSDTGLRQLRKILADLNLRVSSVAFPTRRGYSSPADLQQRLEATRAAMQLASRLGAGILVGNLGPLPAAAGTDGSHGDSAHPSSNAGSDERALLTDAVQSLATFGDRVGVRLVVQSAAPPLELTDWIATLPEGTLALDFHPARLIAQGETPAEFVATAGRHIAHVHAVDGVYDLASGQGVEVELGRGTADFPELLGLLEECGYHDWLTIERRSSRTPIDDIGNAVRFLRAL